MLMHTAGRTRRSTGILSVVQLPPKCDGASRWVPKCSSVETFPIAYPSFSKVAVAVRSKTFWPLQRGSASEKGCPRSRTFIGRSVAAGIAERVRAARAPRSECRIRIPPWPVSSQYLVGGDAHDVGASPAFTVPRLRAVAPFGGEQGGPREPQLGGGAEAGERAMARPLGRIVDDREVEEQVAANGAGRGGGERAAPDDPAIEAHRGRGRAVQAILQAVEGEPAEAV